MGVAGLLPALKSIQVTKHLSEFAGQTVAVDAYVWLHKGVYSCATELATGKSTHKYVDYAMHRVRLLRHYKIEPYIVFDGGPLPAKQSTEQERKQRRDEYLARGNILASQGKHAQARECYVKCVDVTPQMAYQLIKALRVENVFYVVAPYEADAQLAYLERAGLAHAILTEDSDLLVYGCKTVLFKLDPVAATVVSVSRKDFASVTHSSSDISLVGWTDVQFRAMAILSGCDYLANIPGIGLKTACSLLRKWKTVEQVVRSLILEGKKAVPQNYLQEFRRAEKCFLHQRVYCPLSKQLVHLTDVDGLDWNDDYDTFVGHDIGPELARRLAQGDIDPVKLAPMQDINSSYKPTAILPPRMKTSKNQDRKGKRREIPVSLPKKNSVLDYFGQNSSASHKPSSPLRSRTILRPPQPRPGKGSGKRTLAEVMEQDVANRQRNKQCGATVIGRSTSKGQPGQKESFQSKFFSSRSNFTPDSKHTSTHMRRPQDPGPSRVRTSEDKENVFLSDGELNEVTDSPSDASYRADNGGESMDIDIGEEASVQQEDGYISPFDVTDTELDAPELSSPVRPKKKSKTTQSRQSEVTDNVRDGGDTENDDDDFGVEAISSPPRASQENALNHIFAKWEYSGRSQTKNGVQGNPVSLGIERRHSFPLLPLRRTTSTVSAREDPTNEGRALHPCPSSGSAGDEKEEGREKLEAQGALYKVLLGPDVFLEDTTEIRDKTARSENQEARNEDRDEGEMTTLSTPSASPVTPCQEEIPACIVISDDEEDILDMDDEFDSEQAVLKLSAARSKAVMVGWRTKWARKHDTVSKGGCNSSSSRETPKKTSTFSPIVEPSSAVAAPVAFITSPGMKHKKRPRKSAPGGMQSLKRSGTNVTPRGRHSLLGSQRGMLLRPWFEQRKLTVCGTPKAIQDLTDLTIETNVEATAEATTSMDGDCINDDRAQWTLDCF